MNICLCYLTNRRDPKIEWFWEAIHRQAQDHKQPLPRLMVVDFYRPERKVTGIWEEVFREAIWVEPMPSPWNGRWRKTKENWFSAASARNSALIWAPDGTDVIAYVDDLSCPQGEWLVNLNQSATFNGVTLGAYRKVFDMEVKNGMVVNFRDNPQGRDNRWAHGAMSGSVMAQGDMLYGCSLLGPLEKFLAVGGWPSRLCDGLGFEDVIMGTVMANAGVQFNYNRNLLTYEADELHGAEPAFRKESFEKHPGDTTDKGHAALREARSGKFFNNWSFSIRDLRKHMQAGGQWPEELIYTTDWHTNRLLEEL